jgi:phytoene/squalene synthetase
MSKKLFDTLSIRCSRLTTHMYSTSFSLGIRCFDKELRDPVYTLYGFVRFADEIVDTFHDFNKADLLQRFKEETHRAIADKISFNPILNSFQSTVHKYGIEPELYNQFLKSMELDLTHSQYDHEGIEEYILGSAQVVGLMCLRIFCNNNKDLYQELKPSAMRLGSAFQKINFLRDVKADFIEMGRTYFPGVDLKNFDESTKKKIEVDIAADFHAGYLGIKKLPKSARLGVYVAYLYYLALFEKIKKTSCHSVMQNRIRIYNRRKFSILAYSFLKHQLNLI